MPDETLALPQPEIRALALNACRACGASEAMAQSLVEASLAAERAGRSVVGLGHLLDHLDSLRAGRIRGMAQPIIDSPAPAMICIDAGGGIAQLGFDLALEDLADRARRFGLALLTQRNIYPAGELGHYVRKLAELGLIGIAAGNAHPLMATAPGMAGAVFSTNPLAFAAPLAAPQPPLVIDQASSATAFISILRAEAAGEPLPEGWAVDAAGQPTTDPGTARQGALLPFGGYKGANVALMVEILAAGVSGANWSLDTGNFMTGDTPPAAGMTVIALDAEAAAPGFAARLSAQAGRLASRGVHIPGQTASMAPADAPIPVRRAVLDALTAFAGA